MRAAFYPLCALILATTSTASQAASVLVNTSFGRGCYLATFHNSGPETDRKDIAVCDMAMADANDEYDRFAALVNRADIRLRMKDFQAAVEDSAKAIALRPAQPNGYINHGAGLVGMKRYGLAISDLDKAIELGTSDLQIAFYNRALAKELLGDIRGAYFDYKKASEADPKFTLATDELSRFTVVHSPPSP
jgi:tetratricopeptide (TPR) repeat protein